jgi:Protein of unknown function (DUF2845)
MKPMIILAAVFICATFAPVRPASANTLRCGAALIEPGDDAAYVLEKCGEPNQPPTRGNRADFDPYAIWHADRWRYYRGPGEFPVVLVIGADGRVESIRYEKHRE